MFDNLEEDKSKKPSLSEKKEPFLEYSENSNDKVEQNTLDYSVNTGTDAWSQESQSCFWTSQTPSGLYQP